MDNKCVHIFIGMQICMLPVLMYIITTLDLGCQMVCFQTKNPDLSKLLEGLRMENVGIFYDHLKYFMAIWYHLWPFGIVCGYLVYFSHFGMFGPRKIWQPCS
jgi:hypothetical protein